MHPSAVAFLFRDLNLLRICDSVLKIQQIQTTLISNETLKLCVEHFFFLFLFFCWKSGFMNNVNKINHTIFIDRNQLLFERIVLLSLFFYFIIKRWSTLIEAYYNSVFKYIVVSKRKFLFAQNVLIPRPHFGAFHWNTNVIIPFAGMRVCLCVFAY